MLKEVEIRQCNKYLLGGGVCVHVKDSPRIAYEEYESYGVNSPFDIEYKRGYGVPDTTHRHSHSWQPGDARYPDIDGYIIDMETGEVVGDYEDLGQEAIKEIIKNQGIYYRKPELNPNMQSKAREALVKMYGFQIPEEFKSRSTLPPAKGYKWHYKGTHTAIGVDDQGHNVEYDYTTEKVHRIYSLNERREAVAYARRFGATKAAKKFDIPYSTLNNWARRSKAA